MAGLVPISAFSPESGSLGFRRDLAARSRKTRNETNSGEVGRWPAENQERNQFCPSGRASSSRILSQIDELGSVRLRLEQVDSVG